MKTESIIKIFAIGTVLATVNCSKPSEKECVEAHLHNVKIVAQDPEMPTDMKELMLKRVLDKKVAPEMIESCIKNKTRDQIKCEMAAEDITALSLCKKLQKDEALKNPHK